MCLSFDIKLKTGAPVHVRPVAPTDRHLLQYGFDHLSERSRYFRFLQRRTALTDAELDFLTSSTSGEHIVIGALDTSCMPARPAGVARYVRDEIDRNTAEIAVTITDRYQGKGLGTAFIAALAFNAASAGLTSFNALVHSENETMLGIFRGLGAEIEPASKGEVRLVMPVHGDAKKYPENKLGDRMREIYKLLEEQPSCTPSS